MPEPKENLKPIIYLAILKANAMSFGEDNGFFAGNGNVLKALDRCNDLCTSGWLRISVIQNYLRCYGFVWIVDGMFNVVSLYECNWRCRYEIGLIRGG
jgi:hypothetical protein